MAVIKKTLFAENLDRYQTFVNDTDLNSEYFKITELSDTFTGGKNAFLIQGTEYLVPDTLIKIEIKDAQGNIIYHEPGEGIVSSSVAGQSVVTEYYEGVSKVVAVYIYPDTSYGPATITILGELATYNNNGLVSPIPIDWEGKYNVKWQRQINVNPSLANTTKIRFYKRPTANISETLAPIYTIISGSKVASNVISSFANIKLSQIDTFAGDVKRIKVYRTSQGDISDYDMIQDILVESKEELTSYNLSGSVVGNAGLFTSEVLEKLWTTSAGMSATLDSTKVDNGVKLIPTNESSKFTYTSSLNLSKNSVYEFGIDAVYTSTNHSSNMYIYVSGSTNGEVLIGTLEGITPTKNLKDSIFQFSLNEAESTASLYLIASGSSDRNWYIGNLSLKLTQDTAFSPSEIEFITSMPTVIGNETYNFKFEFYDVNNNYVPVEVTQSALFTGGNNNVGGTLTLISASASSSLSQLYAVSSSISGTMTVYSSSASGSILSLSSSVSTSVLALTGSISSSLSSSIGYASSSVYTLSGSVSASITSLSSSVSQSVYQGLLSSFKKVQDLADGNYSGSYISGNIIYSPVVGGQLGYFSTLFKVGKSPNSIYLDARQTPRKIFIGGAIPGGGDTEYSGAYNNSNTSVYLDSSGQFSLGNKLSYDGSNLTVNGTINVTGGNAATDANALLYSQRAAASASISASAAQSNAISTAAGDATTKANLAITVSAISASNAALSASNAYTNAKAVADAIANGTYSGGTLISSTSIISPVIAGANGYISNIFKVGSSGITLDGTNKAIYIGAGTYGNANTGFYVDKDSNFSLGNKLTWDGTTLNITGNITVSGGNAATTSQVSTAQTTADNAATAASNAATAASNAQTTANGKISAGGAAADVNSNTTTISGGKIRTGIIESTGYSYSSGNFSTTGTQINLDNGLIRAKNFAIDSSGNAFFKGDISGASGTFTGALSGATITGGSLTVGVGDGRVIIDTTDFQTRYEDDTNDNTITIGPGGIIIKGEHQSSQSTPVSYISLQQVGNSARQIITAYANIEPLAVLGFGSGNNTAAVNVYNGGFQARNYATTAYGYNYAGNGNAGYAIQSFGNVYVYGNGTFTGTVTQNASDRRLKTNINNINSPLEKISQLNGVYFNWNETAKEIADKNTEEREIGLIAQEVQSVLPEIVKPAPFDIEMDESITDRVVYKSKSGEDYLTIQYEKIIPLLVECIKELKAEIEILKNK